MVDVSLRPSGRPTAARSGHFGIAGRLGGADIARAEQYREGKVPLQTLRVPIDYGFAEAETTWGIIGVKTWITHDEEKAKEAKARGAGSDRRGGGRGRGGPGGGGRGRGGPGVVAVGPVVVAVAADLVVAAEEDLGADFDFK